MIDLRSPHIGTKQIVEVSAASSHPGSDGRVGERSVDSLHQPHTFVCPLILGMVVLLFDIMKGCGGG